MLLLDTGTSCVQVLTFPSFSESFTGIKTKILLHFYRAVLSNHLYVQCFESVGSSAALWGLLLSSIFQVINTCHVCYLKTFAC